MTDSARSRTTKSSASARNTEGYSLRDKSPLTPKPNTSDTKPPVLRRKQNELLLTPSESPAATESASNFVCSVCKGAELVRNLNLEKSVQDFVGQLDKFQSTTGILKDGNEKINHFSDALKHFIMSFEPKALSQDFSKMLTTVDNMYGGLNDSSNYVAKQSDIDRFADTKHLITKYTELQKSQHDEMRKSYSAILSQNSEKLSSLSMEIKSLKGYITDLKSSNCHESASAPSDDSNSSVNGLFSIGRSGQRIINTKNIPDENPTMYIESYKANAISDEMKHNITAFLSDQKQYFNQHGIDTISFGQ